jgi:Zinc binding domain
MDSCCEATVADASAPRACPACGQTGRSVEPITLKALLRPAALATLSPGAHSFCASASCPVVYFGASEVFRRDDVLVPVFQKEPDGKRLVCYCFDVAEDQILREVEASGASASAERIRALVRDDRCACELRNPQGSCCLGNVTALVRSVEAVRVT